MEAKEEKAVNKNAPWYQTKLYRLLLGFSAAFLLLAGVLDALSNANAWFPPRVTYIGTIVVIVAFCALELLLKTWGIPWRQGDQLTRLRGLGYTPISWALAFIVLLWLPRWISPPTPQAIEAKTDSVTYALPPGLVLGRVIRTIVEDDNSSPVFSRACNPILRMKVRDGQIRADNRMELIRQLQYRLISAPTPPIKIDAVKLADKGLYEINCSH